MRFVSRAGALFAMTSVLATYCPPAAAGTVPFVPEDDGEVLERLPVAAFDPEARRLRTLRRELSDRPDDLDLALRVAGQYLEQGRTSSDPRYYGYAQGALAPWWDVASPPAAVLVLRATIRQHDHDFTGALTDLDLALSEDPASAQAWLTRAVVLQVLGDYAEAKRSCTEVLRLSTPLVAATCLGGAGSLSGEAAQSYDLLRNVMARNSTADRAARVWALTTLAEIAARRGEKEAAERHFREAMAAAPADPYLLGAYADYLLDAGRPAEVLGILRDATRADGLLLRVALAEDTLVSPERDVHVQTLRDRFTAARLRGDAAHRREEARFALHLLDDPQTALQLARDNWQTQREPSDARILLESALAAGEPAAAEPVVVFLARNATEDQVLARLVNQLSRTSR